MKLQSQGRPRMLAGGFIDHHIAYDLGAMLHNWVMPQRPNGGWRRQQPPVSRATHGSSAIRSSIRCGAIPSFSDSWATSKSPGRSVRKSTEARSHAIFDEAALKHRSQVISGCLAAHAERSRMTLT